MSKISERNDKYKKLKILLALSFAQQHNEEKINAPHAKFDCPNEEMIAAYFDNKLSIEEKTIFLARLNQCPESFELWSSMIETLDFAEQSEKTLKQQDSSISISHFISDLFVNFKNWFLTHQGSLTGAMATGFLFLFVINFTYTPFAQLPIDKQIVKIWESSEALDLAYVDISQFSSNGLTKSSLNIMPFPEKVAFSSGFKQGLKNMSAVSQQVKSDPKTLEFLNSLPNKPLYCENTLCEKETLLNLQLGIWSSFVLQECQQKNINPHFYWHKQNIVVKHFLQEYENLHRRFRKNLNYSNSLIKKVNKIELSLNALISSEVSTVDSKQRVVCNNIKQLALSSIQSL